MSHYDEKCLYSMVSAGQLDFIFKTMFCSVQQLNDIRQNRQHDIINQAHTLLSSITVAICNSWQWCDTLQYTDLHSLCLGLL